MIAIELGPLAPERPQKADFAFSLNLSNARPEIYREKLTERLSGFKYPFRGLQACVNKI
jgi:hypothetical protein